MRNIGERLSYAGGFRSSGGGAGVFFLHGLYPRSGVSTYFGFAPLSSLADLISVI
jgi:hypothetical protein